MNKHVESLPNLDKSITFHYCTVICDVLRPTHVIFWKDNTNCIWFLAFQIFLKWANLPLSVYVQKPKVFQLQGASLSWPHD